MKSLSVQDFRAAVLDEFPEMCELFKGDDDLPFNQIGAFAILTQRAKGAADWNTYERCIRIAHTLFTRATPDLESALYVSFLEHLDFNGPRGTKAWSLLTPELQAAWRRITPQARYHFSSERKGRRS